MDLLCILLPLVLLLAALVLDWERSHSRPSLQLSRTVPPACDHCRWPVYSWQQTCPTCGAPSPLSPGSGAAAPRNPLPAPQPGHDDEIPR